MPKITAMVVKLDNGKFRSVKLSRVKSMFVDPKYQCAGTIREGEGDVFGPEEDKPDWNREVIASEAMTRGGNGDGPVCYVVNGVVVCM